MNSTRRQRVIVHTDPQLVGAAVGAWLATRPDLDVVIDPAGTALATAGAGDVVIVSTPIESRATVLVIAHDRLSVFDGGTVVADGYRNLDQLYSVITERRGSPLRASTPVASAEGGGSP